MGKIDLHLSIDAELLRRAEAAGVDPSRTLEEALSARLENGMREHGQAFISETEGAETTGAVVDAVTILSTLVELVINLRPGAAGA